MREKTVASFGPFDLMHRTVGASRYWYVIHRQTGKQAVTFNQAPCTGRVKDTVAKFRRMTASWPDMSAFDAANMQPDEIIRLKSLRDMFERVSPTEYVLTGDDDMTVKMTTKDTPLKMEGHIRLAIIYLDDGAPRSARAHMIAVGRLLRGESVPRGRKF